jgi:hypothetical protein
VPANRNLLKSARGRACLTTILLFSLCLSAQTNAPSTGEKATPGGSDPLTEARTLYRDGHLDEAAQRYQQLLQALDEFNDSARLKDRPVFDPPLITPSGIILAGLGAVRLTILEGGQEIHCEHPLSDDDALQFMITHHRSRRGWNKTQEFEKLAESGSHNDLQCRRQGLVFDISGGLVELKARHWIEA